MKLQTFNVPDHLSGTSAGQGKGILRQMGEIGEKINKVNEEVDDLALGILEQVSRSEDEVSRALAPIFARAVPHSPEEFQRARDRRELGNPPGKSTDTVGDQLTWEQILTHFKRKKRLWIISRDGDYGTVYDGKGFLNCFLYNELCKVAAAPEVYLFEDMVEGIGHFIDTTGVKAEKRLTPEEAKEVEKEEKALPPLIRLHGDLGEALAAMGKPPLAAATEIVRQHESMPQALAATVKPPLAAAAAEIARQSESVRQPLAGLHQRPSPTLQPPKEDQEAQTSSVRLLRHRPRNAATKEKRTSRGMQSRLETDPAFTLPPGKIYYPSPGV